MSWFTVINRTVLPPRLLGWDLGDTTVFISLALKYSLRILPDDILSSQSYLVTMRKIVFIANRGRWMIAILF
jgi:hypothetical protein